MRSKFVLRARLLSGGLILIALLLGVRLYFVQIVDGEKYENPGEEGAVRRRNGSKHHRQRSDFFHEKRRYGGRGGGHADGMAYRHFSKRHRECRRSICGAFRRDSA